ncbi:hypothetical protein Acid345_4762 [Candidatus Koribacter versatilis Ellin345]|uniref:Uncharacterized protein n=1 Tax=Koribacter versatilis (strain Ellin345) TaxID=204669 RepID=Q1IH89_KORVE|nr:hypothetical protein [Candidatus Koribacter versatilis]ABF43761.1 hypothetical protein Acid345_4762 [Candidatus Koribacter versatilis Ellin345]
MASLSSASPITPTALTRMLDEYLASEPSATVLEDDVPLFHLDDCRYSISESNGKCLLHLWSEERNIVRRVLDAERKNGSLCLSVQRFGKSQPIVLEFCATRDSRSASAKKASRALYAKLLKRVLTANNPGFRIEALSTSMDLERSFSPIYTRALIRRGNSAFAVLGVNATELQPSIDAALGFGILWLEACRRHAPQCLVEGLKLFAPPGTSAVLRQRMAHLNRELAKWELHELEERTEQLTTLDTTDAGNIATRLVHAPDKHSALQRFGGSIAQVLAVVPEAEPVVVSATELAFRLHGLQLAGARIGVSRDSFRPAEQLYFGVRSAEFPVTDDNQESFREYLQYIRDRRTARDHSDPIHRAVPERWIESMIVRDVTVLDSRLDGQHVYSQVPAFAACDRAMIDVLTTTHDGRLAVLELKADEDIHLPLQGLDYWSRVRWHHRREEFQKFGYFTGRELSKAYPLLLLVAPALRVHPTTDQILQYLSPEIDWTLLAIDERWRDGIRVIFRKHSPHYAARR